MPSTVPRYRKVFPPIRGLYRARNRLGARRAGEITEETDLLHISQIRLLYISFSMTHYYSEFGNSLMPTLSYARLQTAESLDNDQLRAHIKKNVMNKHDAQILESFVTFNGAIQKTNLFQPTKVALSFRLNPDFLPEMEYPTRAFGLFLVVGDGFRGFHLRMKDVARGGLRMIMSRNREAYSSEFSCCSSSLRLD